MVHWPERSPHEVLGVPEGAPLDDVVIAYHQQLAYLVREPGPKASPEYVARRPWYIERLQRAYRTLLAAAGGVEPALLDVYWRPRGAPIEGFLHFAGLQYGDDALRAIERFGGEFSAEYASSFHIYRFLPDEDGWHVLDVYCDPALDERIHLIRLRRDERGDPLPPFRERGIVYSQLEMLGQPWPEIQAIYGEPDEEVADTYSYRMETRTNAPLANVEFTCYRFNDEQCTGIAVTWFALEKYIPRL